MKKFLCVILLLCVTAASVAGTSFTVHAAPSGKIESCEWSVKGTVLTISGRGALNVRYDNTPWGNSITELKINEGVTSISQSAFLGCTDLRKVTLPSTLKVIGSSAFSGCTALNSITLPSGLTTIEGYAFANCSALLDITIPSTVTFIGDEVFEDCSVLNNIFVDLENPSFTSVDGVLFSKDKTVLVKYPPDKPGDKYTVPNSVKEIGWGAFEAAWNLLDITLPSGITKIGHNAFFRTIINSDKSKVYGGCFYLGSYLINATDAEMTSCVVKEGTTCIADGAFSLCRDLERITLPEGLLVIGENAFSWSASLKRVYIPKSVTRIERGAFDGCNALETVFYPGTFEDRSKITIGMYNNVLTKATWRYNSCHNGNNHVFKTVAVNKIATCTEMGSEVQICTACKYSEIKTLDAKDHIYGPWTVKTRASCDDVGVEQRICAICYGVEARNIEPKGHVFGESKRTKWPTFTSTGLSEAVCERCGDVETTEIAKTDPTAYIVVACISIPAILAGVITYLIMKKKREGEPETEE